MLGAGKEKFQLFFDILKMCTKIKICKQKVLTELKSHVSITLQNKCVQNKEKVNKKF